MSLAAGSNVDVEAHSLRERLAHAERMLRLNERMVAGLVHDLRTPLMAIKLSAEVALARSQEDAVQQAARRIRTSSDRMSRLFDHLLNLSRVGSPIPGLDLQAGDLHTTVEAVLDEARSTDATAKFEVSNEGDFNGVFDAALLRRAIANVVGTSLQHAGVSRTVTIHFDGTHPERLFIRVTAAGVIPAAVQEQMYKPGPNIAGRELAGPGLGLHEVDGFVRAHGGSVVGRSRAPDGTVFELLLPRDASGAP